MPKEASFNFIPAHLQGQMGININVSTVTINPKGMLFFSTAYTKENNLEGKFIKFYTDIAKRGLAWQIRDTLNADLMTHKEWRLLKVGKTKMILLSLVKYLEPFEIKGVTLPRLEVKKIKDPSYGELSYVSIPRVSEILTLRDKINSDKLNESKKADE